MWAEGFPDTDEAMQGILAEITRRAAPEEMKPEITDDEGEFDLPQPFGGGTKWRSDNNPVLGVSEHYFVEIGEMYHEGRDGDKVLSARWVRANAQNLRTKGACKHCQRLAAIGTDLCAKHCLQAVTKGGAL